MYVATMPISLHAMLIDAYVNANHAYFMPTMPLLIHYPYILHAWHYLILSIFTYDYWGLSIFVPLHVLFPVYVLCLLAHTKLDMQSLNFVSVEWVKENEEIIFFLPTWMVNKPSEGRVNSSGEIGGGRWAAAGP